MTTQGWITSTLRIRAGSARGQGQGEKARVTAATLGQSSPSVAGFSLSSAGSCCGAPRAMAGLIPVQLPAAPAASSLLPGRQGPRAQLVGALGE